MKKLFGEKKQSDYQTFCCQSFYNEKLMQAYVHFPHCGDFYILRVYFVSVRKHCLPAMLYEAFTIQILKVFDSVARAQLTRDQHAEFLLGAFSTVMQMEPLSFTQGFK